MTDSRSQDAENAAEDTVAASHQAFPVVVDFRSDASLPGGKCSSVTSGRSAVAWPEGETGRFRESLGKALAAGLAVHKDLILSLGRFPGIV